MNNKEIIYIFKTYWPTEPSNSWWPKKFQEKFTYLEDNASGVQVGDVVHVIV